MDLEMAFNELSLRHLAPDLPSARRRMQILVSVIQQATDSGVRDILRTKSQFYGELLAPNYHLADWCHDRGVDLDTRLYVQKLASKGPWLDDLYESQTVLQLHECRYKEELTYGLGAACLFDGLAVSVDSHENWNSPTVHLNRIWLDDDDTAQVEIVTVIHASRVAHVLAHREWIGQRVMAGVRDGEDLWARRTQLFPSLEFCESAGPQIRGLHRGHPVFQPVLKKLFGFEACCKAWAEGPFQTDDLPFKTSPEGGATLERFSEERTFLCPDGERRVFSWHARVSPGEWRIHFFPNAERRRIIIGYVGPHLSIATNPT